MRWALTMSIVGVIALAGGVVMIVRAPAPETRTVALRAATPEQTVETTFELLREGEVSRLPELVHADNHEMRGVLNRLGAALGALRGLAEEVQRRMPNEVAALRDGESPSLTALARGELPDGSIQRLLADPFGALEGARDRASVLMVADDTAALMIDSAPAFGVGLALRQSEGRWRYVMPTSLPMLSRWLPTSEAEWSIVASMVDVLTGALDDLRREVRRGKLRTLDDVAARAGEMAWPPLAMCWFAYERARDAREE